MTERRFLLTDAHNRAKAAEFVLNISDEPVMEVIVRPFKRSRTLPQNSRYWASLDEYLDQIGRQIDSVATTTGYTQLEVRRLIAREMPPEYVAILFARTAEVAHEVLKAICGIPTSTKLGTKEFSEFDEKMEFTIADIVGHVNAFANKAA